MSDRNKNYDIQKRAARVAALFGVFGLLATAQLAAQQDDEPYPENLVEQIRQTARGIPGELPAAIAFAKVAESHRPWSAIIEDGSEETFISARTAFQIQYAQRTIMVDSGMDEEVHRYYGFGRTEPYFADVNERVQQALKNADRIVFTHEHGDHIAGVIRSPMFDELAAKSILNAAQRNSLVNSPQLPQIQITQEQAEQFTLTQYDSIAAVAPGVVLITSPGHTPGHQMVFVATQDDREYLLIGDIGWSLNNITELKLRSEQTRSRIGEDANALMQQMRWLRERMDIDGMIVVPSHDDILLKEYAADGILSDALRL